MTYRDAAVLCPACGEAMHAEPTRAAAPQLCDACGGLWIDWFDGEVSVIAAEQEAARLERGTPLPSRPSQPPTLASCPRCARALTSELYRFPDATEDDLLTGVDVLRCPECAGAFVPRGSAHLLLDRAIAPRAADSLTERLLRALKGDWSTQSGANSLMARRVVPTSWRGVLRWVGKITVSRTIS